MSKPVSARRAGAVVLCATWLGAGCVGPGPAVAPRTKVEKPFPVQRILVVSQIAWVDPTWSAPFREAMLAGLRKTGFPAAVQSRNPLAVRADKVRYAAEIAAFNPDIVLVIEPGDGAADQEGRNLTRRFELGLFKNYAERNGRELTWRARITLAPSSSYIRPADMSTLARDIIARLESDRILPGSRSRAGLPPLEPLFGPAGPSAAAQGNVGLPPLKPLFDPASWLAKPRKVKKPPLPPLRPLFGPASAPANGD